MLRGRVASNIKGFNTNGKISPISSPFIVPLTLEPNCKSLPHAMMPAVQMWWDIIWQEMKTTMPRIAKTPCPYRRLSNGEWIQESLQFVPLPFDFILPELHAKPDLWLGETRYLHTLRRLAYEGDADSVRTLWQLQGSDQHKNTELQDLIRCGKATRLAEAIEYCDQCHNKH